MKKLKFILPLIAVLLTVAGVFAMKANKQNVKQAMYYYHYTASGTTLSDYQNPGNWEPSTQEGPGCSGSGKPCVVQSAFSTVNDFVDNINSTSDVDNNILVSKS